MQTWAPILLGNTLMAGALAIAAIVIMRLRRPAIAHALWLLVLIKLVTPPIWDIPIPRPSWQVDEPAPAVVAHLEADTVPQTIHFTAPSEMVEATVAIPEGGTLIVGRTLPVKKPFQGPSIDSILIGLWITGSILWLTVLAIRMRRFSHLAKRTTKASAQIQERANLLARTLYISQSPPVELVPASISPMLWHDLRSTRLLVPEQLLRTLDPEQRDALILHELAHLKRMDHLTRFLEILVTAIFWWHPLVWIARRGLREAEEQCCDAWVIWAMPDSARRYADALVDTLDFLAASPQSLPPGASGLGGLHHLQRRLTMIFTHTPPRAMSWNGRIAILGLIGLLPLGLVRGQEPQLTVPTEPGAPAAVLEIAPSTAPMQRENALPPSASGSTGIPIEKIVVLSAVDLRTSTAIVQEVASGAMRLVKPGRFAGGTITEIVAEGVRYQKTGSPAPLLIKPAMTFEGVQLVGSTLEYRRQLFGTAEPVDFRSRSLGGETPAGISELLRMQAAGQPMTAEERGRYDEYVRQYYAAVAAESTVPTTIPQEQLIVLRSISTNGRGGHVATLLNVATGEMRGFEGAGRIANGGITSVTVQGVQFLKDGSAASLLISPGMNLEGVAIGSVEAYRQRLLGTAEPLPPSRRGGRGGVARGGDSINALMQQRRAQELGQAPAAAPAAPPDKAVVMALIEGMADSEPQVAQNAQQALAGFGKGALPIYIEAMSSESATIRRGALRSIAGVLMREPAYRTLSIQTGQTGGRARGVRGPGAGGGFGGGYAGGTSIATPESIELQATIAPVVVKAIDDTDLDIRRIAGEMLAVLIDQPDRVLPALTKMLESPDMTIRANAIAGLQNNVRHRGVDRIAAQLPAVIRQLADTPPELKTLAIGLLADCGSAARNAVPELLKAMKDPDPTVRAAAATALGQIQSPPAAPFDALDPMPDPRPSGRVLQPASPQPPVPARLIWRGLDLSAAPVSTDSSKLPDIWEERPPGSRSYEVRADVTVIPAGERLMSIAIYWLRSANRFYVQHDSGASSTHHFYGPFEGDPNQVLAPPTSRPAGR